MKKYIIAILCFLSLGMFFSSCSDYLDMEHFFKDRLSLDSVFTKKDYSDEWLAGVYSHLANGVNQDVASKGHTPFNLISDDMFFGDRDDAYRKYKNGEYDEGWVQGSWSSCYKGIRDASTFIHNIHMNREMTEDEKVDKQAQARFLRAYFYWILLRKYGPIPLLPENGIDYTLEYDQLAIPRSHYDDCVEYITSELALAAKNLPLHRTNRELARPTKGAALATRAIVYLYAASPLYNGNEEMSDLVDDKGNVLVSQEFDETKWAKAAVAAKDVINLGRYKLFVSPFRSEDQGPTQPKTIVPPFNINHSEKEFPEGWKNIDPFESYRQLFNGALTPSDNPELIFSRMKMQNSEGIEQLVLHQMPFSLKGWNTHGVTQKQADAYYMSDGTNVPVNPRVRGFTENSEDYPPLPANVSLQYANREPRFYASIAYNGSIWENTSAIKPEERHQQIFYYRGEPDGKQASSPAFHIRTGLGVKKYYNPQDSYLEGGHIVPKAEPAIRYAEILLIYAEALNELTQSYVIKDYLGENDITVSRDITEMSSGVSPVRVRAGLPDFSKEIYADVNKFRKALKRERQIEFLGETRRYFDLRRWKDAPVEEATLVEGCNMNMTRNQRDQFYDPIVIPSMPTVFVKKMYLWPIPHGEIKKNKRLTQNPGWTYPY